MKSKKPVLLIDGNNLSHRAYHTHQLSYKGKSVSMIYGIPHMIKSLVTEFRPSKIIVVWDGSKHAQRLKINPMYKSHRKLQQRDRIDFEDFNRQKKVAQRLLKYLGIAQVWRKDMEADDYIYMLSQEYFLKERPVIICSNDKDFHQLICPGISQFMDKPKLRTVLTHENFVEHFGVKPTQWVDYLCLVGDSTDDIPGYRGVGEKKGAAFLQEHHSILDYMESDKDLKLIDKTLLKPIYKVNQMMIDLELFYMTHLAKKVEIEYLFGRRAPKLNAERFVPLALKYGMKTFVKSSFYLAFQKKPK